MAEFNLFEWGPAGRGIFVDASGNLQITSDPNASGYIVGYGEAGHPLLVDASGRLLVKDANAGSGSGSTSGTVLISSDDTTYKYVEDAIVAGSGTTATTLNAGGNETLRIALANGVLAEMSTGLLDGGLLSVGGASGTFSVASGTGFHMDNSAYPASGSMEFAITAKTDVSATNLATAPVTYVLIDKDDAVVQQTAFPTAEERRDNIFLGVVVHSDNATVSLVNNIPSIGYEIGSQVEDVMVGLGHFNLSGNEISPSGSGLGLQKSAGTAFKRGANYANDRHDPHTLTLGALAPSLTFRYRNQDSSEGSDVTLIDPATYDNGGTTTAVSNQHQATIQRVYLFPSNSIRIQRGQEVFASFSEAVDNLGKEAFVTESNIDENALLLASIVVAKRCTDISNTADALIFKASRFGELGSVGSSAVGTLQQAYDNSATPEITTSNGAITLLAGETDGDIVFEIQNGSGVNQFTITGSGNVSGIAIGELDDVNASPSLEDSLVYDGSQWVASGVSGGGSGASSLSALTDTTISTPASGDELVYDGSKWINKSYAFSTASGTTTLNYTTDRYLKVDTSGGDVTINLPLSSGTGSIHTYNIWKVSSDLNNVIVSPSGSDTIIGESSFQWSEQWSHFEFVADTASGWLVK